MLNGFFHPTKTSLDPAVSSILKSMKFLCKYAGVKFSVLCKNWQGVNCENCLIALRSPATDILNLDYEH